MRRLATGLVVAGAVLVCASLLSLRDASAQVTALNPIEGNQGFLVVVHDDATLGGDESEGPIALGGDLQFSQFQIIPAVPATTPTLPGDAQATALYVGGQVDFANSSGILQINNSGYVKIGDLSNAEVRSTDPNNATANTRVHSAGAGWDDTPRLQLTTSQPVASAAAPVPPLFDFDGSSRRTAAEPASSANAPIPSHSAMSTAHPWSGSPPMVRPTSR